MEQNKERNFVCRFCSKRFPCGKALGGHIRTHMNENSVESDEEDARKLKISSDNFGGGLGSYVLRENPKKTKRFVDQSEIALRQQLICRECGKGFNSLKALCGHMACHSEREKMVMDSQSDTETSSTPSRRRSKRVKNHKGVVGNQSNSASYANGNSSSVSEIEQEQEELAMCLMMLSRDSSFKRSTNNLNSLAESSDNNSVILETKSSSVDARLNFFRNCRKCGFKPEELLEMQKQREKNSKVKYEENNSVLLYDSDNSDSGYFRNGPKKVESDVSVDGFLKVPGFNKTKEEFGSRFEEPEAKSSKSFSKFKSVAEFEKDLINNGADRASTKYDLRKNKRILSYSTQKKSKYEIKTNGCTESVYESGENSLEADSCAETKLTPPGGSKIQSSSGKTLPAYKKPCTKKKNKGHECPICFRVFKSGQALGGHKRSHFMGNQGNSTVVIQEEVSEMHGLIDLNLPAPVDE